MMDLEVNLGRPLAFALWWRGGREASYFLAWVGMWQPTIYHWHSRAMLASELLDWKYFLYKIPAGAETMGVLLMSLGCRFCWGGVAS